MALQRRLKQVLKSIYRSYVSKQGVTARCEDLVFRIAPFIELFFSKEVERWEKDKRRCEQEYTELREKVPKDVNKIHKDLKIILASEGILEESNFKARFNELQLLLDKDSRVALVFPYQEESMVDSLKGIVCLAVELGRDDLVSEYKEHLVVCSFQKNLKQKTCNCPYLFNKKFVPSFLEMQDCVERFYQSNAGAWNVLTRFKSDWSMNRRDFFRKKFLDYSNSIERERSRQLLELQSSWHDVRAIKNFNKKDCAEETNPEKACLVYFALECDKRLQEQVKRVVNSLVGGVKRLSKPQCVFLILEDDIHLRLVVRWMDTSYEIKHLHSFQDSSDNIRMQFLKNLIYNSGKWQEIGCVSGASVEKYLASYGLVGVLAELFVLGKGVNKAKLCVKVALRNKSELNFALISFIKSLKTVRWTKIQPISDKSVSLKKCYG